MVTLLRERRDLVRDRWDDLLGRNLAGLLLAVAERLASLPAPQRADVVLSFGWGYPLDELAADSKRSVEDIEQSIVAGLIAVLGEPNERAVHSLRLGTEALAALLDVIDDPDEPGTGGFVSASVELVRSTPPPPAPPRSPIKVANARQRALRRQRRRRLAAVAVLAGAGVGIAAWANQAENGSRPPAVVSDSAVVVVVP